MVPNAHATRRQFVREDSPAAVLCALAVEAGGIADRLEGVITTRTPGFLVREGWLQGNRVLLAITGVGAAPAARAAEAIILAHRPRLVISAGFAGGLATQLKRHEIVVADTVVGEEHRMLHIDLSPVPAGCLASAGVHVGKLLTVGRLVSTVAEKSALYAAHGALAVEMESLAVAEVCQGRNVPFLAIRAVTDPAHESLPPGVERLLRAKTLAGRLGAAVGDILRRPASIKQLYNLWETALMAADALGRFLTQVLTGHTAVRARHPQAKNSPDEKSSLSGNPDIL